MAYAGYERLSAMDAMFLEIEDPNLHMHMGSVALFEAAPLRRAGGGLDLERLFALAEARLHRSPRLRQKLATVPGFGRPIWVDDAHFDLRYHLRHTALPHPGETRQLKRLAGRILSQPLDRGKPLWEMCFVEGVEGERFGVVTKLHHCLADGVSSGDLVGMMLGTRPDFTPSPAPAWIPSEAPDGARLIADELVRSVTGPLSLLGGSARPRSAGDTGREGDLLGFVREAARGAWRAAEVGLRPRSETPLNVAIGPHRRFDWTRLDLAEVRRVAREAGGTINDVLLAVVAGTIRGLLERRAGIAPDTEFRVAVPVSLRTEGEPSPRGNRVSSLIATLPIGEPDPRSRLLRVVETMRDAKQSGERQAVDLLGQLADWLPIGLMARVSQAGSRVVNMVVTNVPGARVPVYMLGARMLETYPVVPLMANQALNIAIYSYDGGLFWGFNADRDALTDLHELVEAVPAELEVLIKAAG